MREMIDCAQVPPGKRLAYWQEQVGGLFPQAQVSMADPDGFEGRIAWRDFGPLVIADLRSVAQCVTRSRQDVDAARADVFELNLQIAGEGLLTQCGRTAITPPGTFTLYDSARPFAMQFDGPFHQMTMQMPQALLRHHVWNADAYSARPFSAASGPGKALALLMEHCLTDTADLPQAQEEALAGTLMDLLGQCITGLALEPAKSRWGRRRTLRRLKDVLLEHMANQELTPAFAAAKCGISVRYAHQLFETETQSLSRWLMTQRLEAAKRALKAPGNQGRTLADIAFSCGFSDSASFSRAFKAHFGLPPSELRSQSSKTTLSA